MQPRSDGFNAFNIAILQYYRYVEVICDSIDKISITFVSRWCDETSTWSTVEYGIVLVLSILLRTE